MLSGSIVGSGRSAADRSTARSTNATARSAGQLSSVANATARSVGQLSSGRHALSAVVLPSLPQGEAALSGKATIGFTASTGDLLSANPQLLQPLQRPAPLPLSGRSPKNSDSGSPSAKHTSALEALELEPRARAETPPHVEAQQQRSKRRRARSLSGTRISSGREAVGSPRRSSFHATSSSAGKPSGTPHSGPPQLRLELSNLLDYKACPVPAAPRSPLNRCKSDAVLSRADALLSRAKTASGIGGRSASKPEASSSFSKTEVPLNDLAAARKVSEATPKNEYPDEMLE